MLEYNEIKPRKIILFEGQPYEVLDSWVFRKQQRKPVNQTKLRNLFTGSVTEHSFQVSDKVDEADLMERMVVFQYKSPKDGEYWFSEEANPKNRFTLSADIIGNQVKYLLEKTAVAATIFTNEKDEEKYVGLKFPNKIELRVTEAPPNIKGDSATGGNKVVTLETGATVNAPMFINVGDVLVINTETDDYVERANKA